MAHCHLLHYRQPMTGHLSLRGDTPLASSTIKLDCFLTHFAVKCHLVYSSILIPSPLTTPLGATHKLTEKNSTTLHDWLHCHSKTVSPPPRMDAFFLSKRKHCFFPDQQCQQNTHNHTPLATHNTLTKFHHRVWTHIFQVGINSP